MEKLLRIAEMKDLQQQVSDGKISFGKMVEIINFKHLKELTELRCTLKKEKIFTESEISQLQSKVHTITGNGDVMELFNHLLGVATS